MRRASESRVNDKSASRTVILDLLDGQETVERTCSTNSQEH